MNKGDSLWKIIFLFIIDRIVMELEKKNKLYHNNYNRENTCRMTLISSYFIELGNFKIYLLRQNVFLK